MIWDEQRDTKLWVNFTFGLIYTDMSHKRRVDPKCSSTLAAQTAPGLSCCWASLKYIFNNQSIQLSQKNAEHSVVPATKIPLSPYHCQFKHLDWFCWQPFLKTIHRDLNLYHGGASCGSKSCMNQNQRSLHVNAWAWELLLLLCVCWCLSTCERSTACFNIITSWSPCYCNFTATPSSGLATWLLIHPGRCN